MSKKLVEEANNLIKEIDNMVIENNIRMKAVRVRMRKLKFLAQRNIIKLQELL